MGRETRTGFRLRSLGASGQSKLEYLLGAIVIGLIALFAVARFGGGVARRFKCAGLQVGLVKVDPNTPLGATTLAECSGKPVPTPEPEPPPPPLPPEPPGEARRHHLGDGDTGNPAVGGNLPTEGLSADFHFDLTQDQIDFAKENGNVFFLTFEAFGIKENVPCTDPSCGAFLYDRISPDTVQVDGTTVALARNGSNRIAVSADSLSPGEHVIRLNTGSLSPNLSLFEAQELHRLDDFEYQNLSLGFAN